MLSINERYCAVDGWVVDLENKKVVLLTSLWGKLTPNKNRKLGYIPNLRVFGNIDSKKIVIVDITCDELFSFIKTEAVDFVTLKDRIAAKYITPL